jgi:hypothetical protein
VDWKRRTNALARKESRPLITGFFLWGFIKNLLYGEKIRNLRPLREKNNKDVAAVPLEMLPRTWQEIEYRVDICRATNGAHIQIFYGTTKTLWFVEHVTVSPISVCLFLYKLLRLGPMPLIFDDPVEFSHYFCIRQSRIRAPFRHSFLH